MPRPPLPERFLRLAESWAEWSTCPRAHVGCVIARGNRVLSQGYNGSPPGAPHCEDVGCYLVEGHCRRTIHAEQNAILWARGLGIDIRGATIYCTHKPCPECRRQLAEAGIERVYYRRDYGESIDDPDGIEYIHYPEPEGEGSAGGGPPAG